MTRGVRLQLFCDNSSPCQLYIQPYTRMLHDLPFSINNFTDCMIMLDEGQLLCDVIGLES
jgi:hypothetical protein